MLGNNKNKQFFERWLENAFSLFCLGLIVFRKQHRRNSGTLNKLEKLTNWEKVQRQQQNGT